MEAPPEAVKVVARIRPPSGKELAEGREKIAHVEAGSGMIVVEKPGGTVMDDKDFTFESVFDETASQQRVFEEVGRPIVNSVLQGYNGTILAYGQTGAGKSYTLAGPEDAGQDMEGIIPRSFRHLWAGIDAAVAANNTKYVVRGSCIEIHNEQIRDLLAEMPDGRCLLRESPESGVYVQDQTTLVLTSVEETNKMFAAGLANRGAGAPSRTYFLLTIIVEQRSVGSDGGGEHIQIGKLKFVKFAGSEKVSKTNASADRLQEAKSIGLSLCALGNVISALTDSKTMHVPYRDSKITRLLQDSLGGTAKTVLIANIGPADHNHDETLSTLRLATRTRQVRNRPKINTHLKQDLTKELQAEISQLASGLAKSSADNDKQGLDEEAKCQHDKEKGNTDTSAQSTSAG